MTSLPDDEAVRLEAIERQIARLAAEVAQMRVARAAAGRGVDGAAAERSARTSDTLGTTLSRGLAGGQLESFLGRYGTLLLAALVMLMAVGVLVETAVARGLLTPVVRVALGALAAVGAAGAGIFFRRRGDVRYGDVLLAIAIALLDLVAWGAGPELHVVPPLLALAIVEAAAIGIAVLAITGASEFLFLVAVGGALLAPFVTSEGGGTAVTLLGFGATVLVSSTRAVRDAGWRRAFGLLVGGAAVYALAGSAMPRAALPTSIDAVAAFITVIAAGALFMAPRAWRSDLARCLVAVGCLGVPAAWARGGAEPILPVAIVALGLAAVTYAALSVRDPAPRHWTASALALPLVSFGVALPAAERQLASGTAAWIWAGTALMAWRSERSRGELERGGTHLLAGGVLGALAIADGLATHRIAMVAALALWGAALAWASRDEESTLPLAAVAVSLGGASLAAIAQLVERAPYTYVPFGTAASLSALLALLGLLAGGELVGASDVVRAPCGGLERWSERPIRRAVALGFVLLWGHVELTRAVSPDVSTALTVLYWAAMGLGVIVAGRRLGAPRLRAAGLTMALGAAVGAVADVASISGVGLRVGSYGLVGLFLLGTGYLYRERREGELRASPG